MLAAVLTEINKLELRELPIPEPGQGQVLVRIKSCGICATDYKAIKGIRRNVTFPTIPGHEPAGVVDRIGPGVIHVKEGDDVIVQPSGFCGYCPHCRMGNTHYCEHSFTTGGDGPPETRMGSFAEYTLCQAEQIYKKPRGMSFDAACQTEPISGAWKGVVHFSNMKVGDDVVIIGAGGIGMYCLMIAKAAGAGRLIAVDISTFALNTAKKLGATHILNPKNCNIKEEVYKIMPGGPDLVVEAAGPIEAVRTMITLLRRGTKWNVFGITTHEKFELDGGLVHFLEARMDSSFGTNPLAMQNAIRLMERGLVNPEKVISHYFSLSEIHEAIDIMGTTKRNKIVIHP